MTTPPEYAAARHIFSAPSLAGRLAPFIEDGDFDWPGIFSEAKRMSPGQRLLIRAAHDLWTAQHSVGLTELTRQLDSAGFTRVTQAMRICRGETATARPAAARPVPGRRAARHLRVVS